MNRLTKIRASDVFVALIVWLSSHLFFVTRDRAWAIVSVAGAGLVLHFLKKPVLKKLLYIVSLFFCTFWLLEIPYPYVGALFWPVDHFIGALVLYSLLRHWWPTKPRVKWRWHFDKKMALSVGAIVVPSVIILVLYFVAHPEVADQWPLPEMPGWAVPLAVILIALLNGLREEIYFRFALQNHLDDDNTTPGLAIFCAAIAFGYMHFQGGFPSGGLGVFLTTLFGVIIGIQFHYFKSAPLTWITHSITDAAMFAIILLSKR